MMHTVKVNSIFGLTIMLSLIALAPVPSFAECKNAGGSSGSSKVGSQVNGSTVTICASAIAITPARSTTVQKPIKTVTKVAVKPASKPVLKPVAQPAVFRRTQAALPKPKIKTVIKQKAVTKVISKPGSTNKTSAAADFRPASVVGSVYPGNDLLVGELATFASSAVQHYRTGTLLNLPTEVRFTPINVSWDFGDGTTASGSETDHEFQAPGAHQVQLRVVYAVSYRIKGSQAWLAEPDTITMSDVLSVSVSASGTPSVPRVTDSASSKRVLLVGEDCISKPVAFGCH
jgi:hypothetical protein